MTALLLRLLPLALAFAYGLAMWRLSAGRMARRMARQSTPLAEPGLAAALARLARAMNDGAAPAALPVRVYETPEVNGFAAPDGGVYLTRGFLEMFRRGQIGAEEIASVVAHELGHVAHGHARRRMIDAAGAQAAQGALGLALGRLIPFAGGHLARLAATAFSARMSRSAEYEADEFATALMLKAGFGAAPQIALLETLDAMGRAPGPAWLASHPPTQSRIARIRENLAKWGA